MLCLALYLAMFSTIPRINTCSAGSAFVFFGDFVLIEYSSEIMNFILDSAEMSSKLPTNLMYLSTVEICKGQISYQAPTESCPFDVVVYFFGDLTRYRTVVQNSLMNRRFIIHFPTSERVAQYLRPDSWLFGTIELRRLWRYKL